MLRGDESMQACHAAAELSAHGTSAKIAASGISEQREENPPDDRAFRHVFRSRTTRNLVPAA